MNPRVGPLATDHQAGHLGRAPVVLGHHLVEAGSGTNLAAVGQRRPGKHVAGLGAVDVALERLGVVEPADEDHALAIIGQGLQHPAELHLIPCPLGPPLLAVEPVAGKQHSQADRGLVGGARARSGHGIPNRQRLHPGQRHGDAQPPQEFSSRKLTVGHDRPRGIGERDCPAILPQMASERAMNVNAPGQGFGSGTVPAGRLLAMIRDRRPGPLARPGLESPGTDGCGRWSPRPPRTGSRFRPDAPASR